MKKILALIVPLIALVGGAMAGNILRPVAAPEATEGAEHAEAGDAGEAHGAAEDTEKSESPQAWFAFPNQFFVPVVRNGRIGPIMILTITLETTEEARERVEMQEHKLRDALLRSMLVFANTGGFDGNFTAAARMRSLRDALLTAAQEVSGADVTGILIEDIARQDS